MTNLNPIQLNEQLEHEGQIRFVDFSFFPVVDEKPYDLAVVDDGFGNVGNSTGVGMDFNCSDSVQIDFNDTSPINQDYDFFADDENTALLHVDSSEGSPNIVADNTDSGPDRSIPSSLQANFSFTAETNNKNKFKPFQEEKWNNRFDEFLRFVQENGHGAVPYTYPSNPHLARWVKRQRRQYKLKREGRSSTMTTERMDLLSSVGFVWDSHEANWKEKLAALNRFRFEHGHCNVPTKHKDQNLGAWVKGQRRHYKRYCEGKPSSMNRDRIEDLQKLGFEWRIR